MQLKSKEQNNFLHAKILIAFLFEYRDSNVILWLSAIYSELHKYTPYHVNSVRDYFDRSTQDTRTKSSILLWKCYIQFELLQENMQKARSLFYRSVRECPWSKGEFI